MTTVPTADPGPICGDAPEVATDEPVSAEAAGRSTVANSALDALLRANPDALVAAFDGKGSVLPPPQSVQLHGQRIFQGSGLDLVVAEDQVVLIAALARARYEPIVRVDVRLLVNPDEASTVHFFDLRPGRPLHLIVLETNDPTQVLQSLSAQAPARTTVAHMTRDGLGVILEVDEAMTLLLGWTAGDLIGHGTLEFVHPDDVERALEGWIAMRTGTDSGRVHVRYRHANGHHVWLEVSNDNHLDDADLACVESELIDISGEMADLEALHQRERLLARLAEALPIGICHVRPDREVVYTNEPLVSLLGVVDSIDALLASVAAPDREPVEDALAHALAGQPGNLEVGVVHLGEQRRCELTFRSLETRDGGIDGVIVCAADVTDRSRLRSELEHRASHDALSGCLNRAATVAALEESLRSSQQVAVAFIDLDHLKRVNDELGHAAGDELLRVAAARLRSATRAEDRIGRVGGDEFVVICPRGQDPFEAAALVGRLTEAINGDVVIAKHRVPLRASIGATVSEPHEGAKDAEAVLSRADAAMYAMKRSDPNWGRRSSG